MSATVNSEVGVSMQHAGEVTGADKPFKTLILPKAPVFDWPYSGAPNHSPDEAVSASVEECAHKLFTSSGRAALYQALTLLRLPGGTPVLVPGYHCPSMIAPVIKAGLQPVFFGVRADGTPMLEAISPSPTQQPRVLIAAHYFGLPVSLEATRTWCDERKVILIEDCAHCLFGQAGGRPVGHWGDYAIASLTKFFPVPEAGLLVSNTRSFRDVALSQPSARAQFKGWLDVLEVSNRHGRLRGIGGILRPLFAAKNRLRFDARVKSATSDPHAGASPDVTDCDMGRAEEGALSVSRMIVRHLDRAQIYRRRRENYGAYVQALRGIAGSRLVHPTLPDGAAPYVCPLLVDDAERVYQALRKSGVPVFRWDRVWPQAPQIDGDVAPLWRHHVLQLLCHQDLNLSDIMTICLRIALLLGVRPDAVGLRTPREELSQP